METQNNYPSSNFQNDGFALVEDVVALSEVEELLAEIETLRRDSDTETSAPGLRHLLHQSQRVRAFANSQSMRDIVHSTNSNECRPVKAILFDKTQESNWYVTWHQDLTIAVETRIDIAGYGPWSVKDAIPHVQPSADVLKKIVALRVHLDDCLEDNGAIKFFPGTHSSVMDQTDIARWRERYEPVTCPAKRGDVIMMRPLILHASSKASKPVHRRVLHIEYSSERLPGGLSWAEL